MNTLIKKRSGPEFLQFMLEKQCLFAAEFIIDFNGTQAAIRAGYAKSSAGLMAMKLLKKPVVQKAMRYFTGKRLEKVELTADEVIKQLRYALTRRVGDLQDENGNYLAPKDLPDHMQSIVDEVKVRMYYNRETGEQEQEVRYKLTPHAAARDQSLRYCNLLVPDLDKKGEEMLKLDWDSELGKPPKNSDIIEKRIEGIEE